LQTCSDLFLYVSRETISLTPAPESLDRKYGFEPVTGHKFFSFNMILLYLKILNQSLSHQGGQNYVFNRINCCTQSVTPTEKKWTRCSESVPIPAGVMLPDYRVRTVITLPPAVVVCPDGGPAEPEPEKMSTEQAPDSQSNASENNQS
jgi:hypothetical protein